MSPRFSSLRFSSCVSFLSLATLGAALPASAGPLVMTVGDSTVATQNVNGVARGWGQVLPEFFVGASAGGPTFTNQGSNGTSSKSFYELPQPTSKWETALTSGADYVFIQFGTNDVQVSKPDLYTDPATTFRDFIRAYVNESRAAGMSPILVTPAAQRYYTSGGLIDNKLRNYALGMIAVADELDVPLIDLNAATAAHFNQIGQAQTEALFVVKTDGTLDTTHHNAAGARLIAGLVTQGLSTEAPELSALLVPEPVSLALLMPMGILFLRPKRPA